ncbi:MAG: hypothetical protein ABIP94_22575 [Planctomycetota bacterium]
MQQRRAHSIMWIVALLLLTTVASHLRLSVCLGNCGNCHQIDKPGAASYCPSTATQGDSACCCCAPHGRAHLHQARLHHRSDARDHGPGDGTLRGTCEPGCCIALEFESVDLVPAPTTVDIPQEAPLVCVLIAPTWPLPDGQPLTRGRPFDRGPPGFDRRTALRACTVLLI